MRFSCTQYKTGVCTGARKGSREKQLATPSHHCRHCGWDPQSSKKASRKFLREYRGPGGETARLDCVGKVLNTVRRHLERF